MGDRNAGEGGRGDRRRHAGHDLEGDAGAHEGQRFLAAASENEGIAGIEANHSLAATGGADEAAPQLRRAAADGLLGPTQDLVLAREEWGIDFGAEVAIVSGDLRQGATPMRRRMLALIESALTSSCSRSSSAW